MHIKRRFLTLGTLAGLGLAACQTSGTNPSPNTNVANIGSNVLQMSVGTANIYGDAPGSAQTGLNLVTTYRQPAGATDPGGSGVLASSPTFTVAGALPGAPGTAGSGDATSTILTGPAPSEVGKSSMTATSQVGGTTGVTTFGQSGGVFGLGIEPFNYTANGSPFQVAPYPVPIYDAVVTDPNQLPAAWGGPPAFTIGSVTSSPVGSGSVPGGTAGVSEGLDVFSGVAPVAGGKYSLTVAVNANTGTTNQTKTATLGSADLLPAITPPLPVLDANGDGGGTFAITLPAGVSEAYIEIIDSGTPTNGGTSCNTATSGTPVYYTIFAKASGTYTLPPALGPGGTPSICTVAQNSTASGNTTTDGDSYTVQSLGFDYPLYEASYPQSLGNPSPAIVGGGRTQSDVTISSVGSYAQPSVAPAGTSIRVPTTARAHSTVHR